MNDLSGSRRGFEKRKICRSIFMVYVLCLVLLLTACVTDTGINADYNVDDILQYPKGPITLEKYYDITGDWWRTTEIESFEITDIGAPDRFGVKISYEVIGTVTGDDYFNIKFDCYDEEGFLIKSVIPMIAVKDGERFKLTKYEWIPPNTVEIKFSDD